MRTFWSIMNRAFVFLLLICALSEIRCDGCDHCTEFDIKISQLPNGTIGTPYSISLDAREKDGKVVACEWSLVSGVLPPGLSMSSGGVISGTPTTAGAYDFSVRAKNISCLANPIAENSVTTTLSIVIQG